MVRPSPPLLRTHRWEATVTDVTVFTSVELTDPDGNKYLDDSVEVDYKGWDIQQASSGEALYNPAGTLTQVKIYQAFAPIVAWPDVQVKDRKVLNKTTGDTYRILDSANWGSHLRIFMEKTS